MDADKHGYLDGGYPCPSVFIRGSFFSTGFTEVVEGNTNKVRGQTFVFTVPLIALFNHGWTRMNTDIWTGGVSVSICVHPWFVLFHWICRSCGGELIKYEVRLSFSRYL